METALVQAALVGVAPAGSTGGAAAPTRILVPFSGAGSGVGELTWGQQGIWQTIEASGESKTLGGVVPLRDGATIQDAVATLRFAMSRHQSLRTRLCFDPDGRPKQSLASSGEVPLEIVDAGDADPTEVAEAVRLRYQSTNFDYVDEWPVRMAVVQRRGRPTHAVAVYLHLALDAHGLDVLIADLAGMDAGTGRQAGPVTGVQPLELARRQRGPVAQRQCAASLRHLERVLRTVPARRFGDADGDREPDYRMIRFHSPATLLGVHALAVRHGVETSPVLLAAFATAVARTVGTNPVVAVLAVSNRFRPGFAGSVSPLAQVSPCVIDVAGVSFAEAVARAGQAAMRAYLHAYYDPARRAELIATVNRERGEVVDLSCFFNDRRQRERGLPTGPVPTGAEIRRALPRSSHRWEDEPGLPKQKLYLDVNDAPGAVDVTMSADTRYLSPADMQAVVRGIEAVLVDAALDGAD